MKVFVSIHIYRIKYIRIRLHDYNLNIGEYSKNMKIHNLLTRKLKFSTRSTRKGIRFVRIRKKVFSIPFIRQINRYPSRVRR